MFSDLLKLDGVKVLTKSEQKQIKGAFACCDPDVSCCAPKTACNTGSCVCHGPCTGCQYCPSNCCI